MRQLGLVAAAVALAAAGCTPAAEETFQPSLQWGDCPSDVEVSFLSRHECGYLTVLEDRSEPAGRTIRMLVAKVWPVGVEPTPGLMTDFGGNVGDPRSLGGGMASGATRIGRVVVQMESRGAGPHSEPSLACPEVDSLDERAASSPTGDPGLLQDFLAAVRSCRDRLTASGVDVAAYDLAEGAADIEDLRVALGIGEWGLFGAEGTQSRFVFEYLRTYPQRVEAAFLDSPWFPEIDDLTGGIAGTKSALAAFFAGCVANPECNQTYPRLEESWRAAMLRLFTSPLQAPAAADSPAVVVDAGKLLRAARFALGGDGPGNLAQLPGIITDAASGRLSPELARIISNDPLFCAGYRPLCDGQDGFGWGVYFTTFCRDQLPFIDREALSAAAAGDAAYEAVFVNSPYAAACDVWDVPPASEPVDTAVATPVPLLLLSGQFDSYSSPLRARDAAEGLEHAWAVEVPGQTHNTLGFSECAIYIRNAWVRAPTAAPADTSCLGDAS